jgi:hypothetical protein
MLAEANGAGKIILAVGYTDLRRSIDGLAQIIGTKYDLNPFEAGVLFLFCGRRTDRIKGLLSGKTLKGQALTVSCSFTKGWKPDILTGRVHRSRLHSLMRSSTTCS